MSEDVKHDEAVEETTEVEETDGNSEADNGENQDTVDYLAELEKQKELNRKKTGALKEERERRREAERKLAEGSEREDTDISSVVRQVLNEDRFEELLEDECPSADYRELVRYHYENTIRQSGSSRAAIKRDIARCKLLADEAKYMSEAEKRFKKSEAEKKAYMKDGKEVRSNNDARSRDSKGQFVDIEGNVIEAKTREEKELLKRFGVKNS